GILGGGGVGGGGSLQGGAAARGGTLRIGAARALSGALHGGLLRGRHGNGLARSLGARRLAHEAVGVGLEVGRVLRAELRRAVQLAGVVVGELHRAVVAGLRLERGDGVRDAVVGVVRLGELDENLRRLFALGGRDVLAGVDALEDGGADLLPQRDVVGPEGARVPERRRLAGAVAGAAADVRLVAEERELALRVVDDGLLH